MSLEALNYGLTLQAFPVAGVLEAAGPSLDLNYLLGTLGSQITFARASTATDGLSTDATGSGFNTFAINVPRLSASVGLLIEEARTNFLKNSGTPATQTTASLATGTYVLWVIGTGSATSSAGTATGSGFGAATAGSPNVFTVTVAGTVTVTVSGSLTRYQLEKGAFATSYIPTTGATATRAKDTASMPVGNWFNAMAMTLVAEAMLPASVLLTAAQFLVEISDGTNNNRITIDRLGSSNTLLGFLEIGGIQLASQSFGTITPGAVFKAGIATGAAGFLSALSGVAGAATSGNGNLPTTTLSLGMSHVTVTQADGFIRRFRYWPGALSQNDLNGDTT